VASFLPFNKLIGRLSGLGETLIKRQSFRGAARRLIPLLPADPAVRNFIVGIGGAATDRAIRREKKRKPVRGLPRALTQVNLGLTEAQGILGNAGFEAIIQATQFIDLATDLILSDTVSEIVDIPEELVTRAAEGYKEINSRLIELDRKRLQAKLSRKR